ncbi:hypothetical protein H2199_008690 [Coniosporium tulheliwenetii]|uniref:Uncharacterized protein n=1 Tax=Coniosporium tulheliwenetii TaxID=3383036 RepID=A0ACC2YJ25_9PEZI|nr:hypothetical protein H2199_008690 [Cladosporium sp. JES 115]
MFRSTLPARRTIRCRDFEVYRDPDCQPATGSTTATNTDKGAERQKPERQDSSTKRPTCHNRAPVTPTRPPPPSSSPPASRTRAPKRPGALRAELLSSPAVAAAASQDECELILNTPVKERRKAHQEPEGGTRCHWK